MLHSTSLLLLRVRGQYASNLFVDAVAAAFIMVVVVLCVLVCSLIADLVLLLSGLLLFLPGFVFRIAVAFALCLLPSWHVTAYVSFF